MWKCYPHTGMPGLSLLQFVAVGLLILANAFFVAAEFALVSLRDTRIEQMLAAAKAHAIVFDDATKPVNQAIDQLEKSLIGGDKSLTRDFTVARLRYTAARYDVESRLNLAVAGIYELQVRQNG